MTYVIITYNAFLISFVIDDKFRHYGIVDLLKIHTLTIYHRYHSKAFLQKLYRKFTLLLAAYKRYAGLKYKIQIEN